MAPVTNRITWSIKRVLGAEEYWCEQPTLWHTTNWAAQQQHIHQCLQSFLCPALVDWNRWNLLRQRAGARKSLTVQAVRAAGDGLAMCQCLDVTLRVVCVTPTSCCNFSHCTDTHTMHTKRWTDTDRETHSHYSLALDALAPFRFTSGSTAAAEYTALYFVSCSFFLVSNAKVSNSIIQHVHILSSDAD